MARVRRGALVKRRARPPRKPVLRREAVAGFIAVFVKSLREMRGLKQAEAARLAGVSPATVCQWEKGTTEPSLSTLMHAASSWRVTPLQFARAMERTWRSVVAKGAYEAREEYENRAAAEEGAAS